MTPTVCLQAIIRPALNLLGPRFTGLDAERMLLAIAPQESGLRHRVQVGGPARGLWQFERGGGVAGVLRHPSTQAHANRVCASLLYEPYADIVYDALADNDILAACFARLLLFSDPHSLPTTEADAWAVYLRTWRPGKPHPDRWPANWAIARGLIP
jgi:hypothetical protein